MESFFPFFLILLIYSFVTFVLRKYLTKILLMMMMIFGLDYLATVRDGYNYDEDDDDDEKEEKNGRYDKDDGDD